MTTQRTVKSQTISSNPPMLLVRPRCLASAPSTPSSTRFKAHAVRASLTWPSAEQSGASKPTRNASTVTDVGVTPCGVSWISGSTTRSLS